MRRLIALLIMTTILSTTITQSALANFSFEIEAIMEGGYDYTIESYTPTYDPEVSPSEYYVKSYLEISGGRPGESEILVDDEDFVHGLVQYSSVGLLYFTNKTGEWVYTNIDSDGSEIYGMEMDDWGNIHVAYVRFNAELVYAILHDGYWSKWVVDQEPDDYLARMADLSLDENGNVHLAYLNEDQSIYIAEIVNLNNRSGSTTTLDASYSAIVQNTAPTEDEIYSENSLKLEVVDGKQYVFYSKNAAKSYMSVRKFRDLPYTLSHKNIGSVGPGFFEWMIDSELDAENQIHIWYHDGGSIYEDVLQSDGSWDSKIWSDASPLVYHNRGDFELNPLNPRDSYLTSCNEEGCALHRFYGENPITTQIIDPVALEHSDIHMAMSNSGQINFLYFNYIEPYYLFYGKAMDLGETVAEHDKTYPSLVSDSEGNPYVAYYNDYSVSGIPSGDLLFADSSTGSWEHTIIDSTGAVGLHPSLAVDSQDHFFVSYYYLSDASGFTKKQLKFASTCADGAWQSSIIDGSGTGAHFVGEYSSIAVDAAGGVHVAYYDETDGNLKYAYQNSCGGSWSTETVDTSAADVGKYVSLAVDSSSTVYISYYDATNKDLKLATGKSGAWNLKTLDSGGDVGQYTSLELDLSEKVHISYYDATNTALNYITNSSTTKVTALGVARGWARNRLDNSASVGMYSSLGIDSNNTVFISYYNADARALMVSQGSLGSWNTRLIDNDPLGSGLWSSLDINKGDLLRVVYTTVVSGYIKQLSL